MAYVAFLDVNDQYNEVEFPVMQNEAEWVHNTTSGSVTVGNITFTLTASHYANYDRLEYSTNQKGYIGNRNALLSMLDDLCPNLEEFYTYSFWRVFFDDLTLGTHKFVCEDETTSPFLQAVSQYVTGVTNIERLSFTGSGNFGTEVIEEMTGNSNSYADGSFIAFHSGSNIYGGFAYYYTSGNYSGNRGTTKLIIVIDRTFLINDVFSLEPGEPGFIPKKTVVNIHGGGRRSGSKVIYTTDKLVNPDAPDESKASAISSGFINAYRITKESLERVGQCLWADNIHTIIGGKITNPMDAIISLNIFPYPPETDFAEHIKFLNHEFDALTFGVDAYGSPLMKQFVKIPFGSINVYECFESFLDYANTNFSIYLPFIGEVSLPINEVMGGKITLDYIIDFFTGMCVANVLCEKVVDFAPFDSAEQYSQHSYQGNCAIQVPLSSGDYGALVGALINMCSTGLRETLETGNPAVGAASAGLEGAKELLSGGMSPAVKTKGSVSANAGYCSVYYPYITIERPISPQPDSYQTAHGYMSYTNSHLSEYEGLCVCEDINLSGIFNATESEKSRIKTLCREGVYV